MLNAASLRTRYAGRPVLMRPEAAREVALQLLAMDGRSLERPGRVGALLRALGMRRGGEANAVRPHAMEDDFDGPPPVPFEERAAYAPLYAGEVEDHGYCWSLKSGVALLQCDTPLLERGDDFCGVHHGYDTLLRALQDAAADERVKASFLRLNCPGGVVAGGLPTLAAWMRENRAAAGGKPIWVYADMAASAAYWIAGQADRIIAPNVGIVGSIGAVLVHEDWSDALDKAGVKVEAIQFGEKKTDGAWWAALSEDARADLQAEIDQCGRNFVADVTAGRPQLTAEALIATQARCYMAEHDEPERSGLVIGFVDEIAGEADAFAALVAHVSTPGTSLSSPTAAGGRAANAPEKDKPMADKAQTQPGRVSAQARTEAARLRAQADQMDPQGSTATEAAEDTEGEDTASDDAAEDTVAGGAADDALNAEDADEDEVEARAIAASAEAKSHPALAVEAIASKMTLAQFKAAARASAPKGRGQLAVVMADASRLGPDGKGSGPAAGAPVIRTAAESYALNREKGLAGRRK